MHLLPSCSAKWRRRLIGWRRRLIQIYFFFSFFWFAEASDDTLMNLDHSCSPTHSYKHARTHTIYAVLLIAPLSFPRQYRRSCFIFFRCVGACRHTHTWTHDHSGSPDVLSSSLLWAEVSQSHRHKPLSPGKQQSPDDDGQS